MGPPRAGSCMHCGHPLPDRSITLCPGCGQDPLLDAAAEEDAESGNTRPLQGGMAVPTTPPRVLCCPQCGGALPQPLPGFCQNCGASEWVSDGEGGRYCSDCGAVHPVTPSVSHPLTDDDLAETATVAGEIVRALWDVRRCAERLPVVRDTVFHEFMRHVGAALVAVQRWTA